MTSERRTSAAWPEIQGYEIEGELGRGAMSVVYKARQTALDRHVAIKVLNSAGESDMVRVLRLLREARVSGKMNHPGIVRGIDAGTSGDLCYFVMEYVEGRSLKAILEREGALGLPEALRIVRAVAAALAEVHKRGVVHRDVKPANILVDKRGAAKLADLGLAKYMFDGQLTVAGHTVGTPQYMAPEQALRPHAVDRRSDLFSLGTTLYQMITGVAPFEAPSVGAVITKLLYEDPPPPSRIVPSLPPDVDAVVMRLLAKEARKRYRSATALLLDLDALIAGRPVPTAIGRRSRVPLGVAAVLVTAGLAFGALRVILRSGSGATQKKIAAVPVPASRQDPVQRLLAAMNGGAPVSAVQRAAVAIEVQSDLPMSEQRAVDALVKKEIVAGIEEARQWLAEKSKEIDPLIESGRFDAAATELHDLEQSFTRFGRDLDSLRSPLGHEIRNLVDDFRKGRTERIGDARRDLLKDLRQQLAAEPDACKGDPAYRTGEEAQSRLSAKYRDVRDALDAEGRESFKNALDRAVDEIRRVYESRYEDAKKEAINMVAEARRFAAAERRLRLEVLDRGANSVIPGAAEDLKQRVQQWHDGAETLRKKWTIEIDAISRLKSGEHPELRDRDFGPALKAVRETLVLIPESSEERAWLGGLRDDYKELETVLVASIDLEKRAFERLQRAKLAGDRVDIDLIDKGRRSGVEISVAESGMFGTMLVDESKSVDTGERFPVRHLTPECEAWLADEKPDPRVIAWIHYCDFRDPGRVRDLLNALAPGPLVDFLQRRFDEAITRESGTDSAKGQEVYMQIAHARRFIERRQWESARNALLDLVDAGRLAKDRVARERSQEIKDLLGDVNLGERLDRLRDRFHGLVKFEPDATKSPPNVKADLFWTFEDPAEASDFALSPGVRPAQGKIQFPDALRPARVVPHELPSMKIALPIDITDGAFKILIDLETPKDPEQLPRVLAISLGATQIVLLANLGQTDLTRKLHGLERDIQVLVPYAQTRVWSGKLEDYERRFDLEPLPDGTQGIVALEPGGRYPIAIVRDTVDRSFEVRVGDRTVHRERDFKVAPSEAVLVIRSATAAEIDSIRVTGRIAKSELQ